MSVPSLLQAEWTQLSQLVFIEEVFQISDHPCGILRICSNGSTFFMSWNSQTMTAQFKQLTWVYPFLIFCFPCVVFQYSKGFMGITVYRNLIIFIVNSTSGTEQLHFSYWSPLAECLSSCFCLMQLHHRILRLQRKSMLKTTRNSVWIHKAKWHFNPSFNKSNCLKYHTL